MILRTNRQHLETLIPQGLAKKWPRPDCKRIFILFTPRSGSSWFGDLLRSTKALGQPDEYLNQETNIEVVRRVGARTETDFLNAIETITASGNKVFSIEVAWGHVELCEFDLLGYYSGAHFIYLRRRDILAQAVSLTLATSTGIYHNPSGSAGHRPDELAKRFASREETFSAIRRWWCHLMNYECSAEVQLLLRGIRPMRIYYEDIVADPMGAVGRVREFCGVPPTIGGPPSSNYTPVSSELNVELAKLFSQEQDEFAASMNAFRPPLS
jgi:LPS sulfotransferase NodH